MDEVIRISQDEDKVRLEIISQGGDTKRVVITPDEARVISSALRVTADFAAAITTRDWQITAIDGPPEKYAIGDYAQANARTRQPDYLIQLHSGKFEPPDIPDTFTFTPAPGDGGDQ